MQSTLIFHKVEKRTANCKRGPNLIDRQITPTTTTLPVESQLFWKPWKTHFDAKGSFDAFGPCRVVPCR